MTRRATTRGEERTSLEGTTADVLVCGASFAGLAVARELAGAGADVLVVDRYAIGERATSACAAPTPWLHAMGVRQAIRQELPAMRFATPHGGSRYELPWSWSSFDYRELCLELWEQCGDARFETAKVEARTADGVATDRGELRRRSSSTRSAGGACWPARAATSRRTRRSRVGSKCIRTWTRPRPPTASTSGSTARSPAPATRGRSRRTASSASVSAPTRRATTSSSRCASSPRASTSSPSAGRATGSRTACAPPPTAARSSPATPPDTACRSRARASAPRSTSASPAGPSCAACWRASAPATRRCVATPPSRSAHARTYRLLLAGQRALPRVPPRALTLAFRLLSHPAVVRRAFTWYLDQAPPPRAADPRRPRPATVAVA